MQALNLPFVYTVYCLQKKGDSCRGAGQSKHMKTVNMETQ